MEHDESRADSVTHIFRQVIDDVRELFREELALARAELREEASVFTRAAVGMAVAAALCGFGVLFVLLGVAQGAARLFGIGVGTAYFWMGIVLGVGAAIALLMSRARLRTMHAVPQRTVASLQETKEWISHRTSSSTR